MPVETQTSKDTIVELSDDSAPERIVHSYRPGMLKRLQRRYREYLAEFLGTFVLIIFGNGVVAQVVLHDNKNGEYLSINLAWGLGVLFGKFTIVEGSYPKNAHRLPTTKGYTQAGEYLERILTQRSPLHSPSTKDSHGKKSLAL